MKRMSYSKSNKSDIRNARKAKELANMCGSLSPEEIREYEKKKK